MTLPASGQISILNIATEFGGTAGHSLSEYYRGAALVPNISANNSIPTSGQISMSNFYGTTVAPLSLASSYLFTHTMPAASGSITEGWTMSSNGAIVEWITNPGHTPWYSPLTVGVGSGYEASIDTTTGSGIWSQSTGAVGSWMNLGSNRVFLYGVDAFFPGVMEGTCILRVRSAGTTSPVWSSNITVRITLT